MDPRKESSRRDRTNSRLNGTRNSSPGRSSSSERSSPTSHRNRRTAPSLHRQALLNSARQNAASRDRSESQSDRSYSEDFTLPSTNSTKSSRSSAADTSSWSSRSGSDSESSQDSPRRSTRDDRSASSPRPTTIERPLSKDVVCTLMMPLKVITHQEVNAVGATGQVRILSQTLILSARAIGDNGAILRKMTEARPLLWNRKEQDDEDVDNERSLMQVYVSSNAIFLERESIVHRGSDINTFSTADSRVYAYCTLGRFIDEGARTSKPRPLTIVVQNRTTKDTKKIWKGEDFTIAFVKNKAEISPGEELHSSATTPITRTEDGLVAFKEVVQARENNHINVDRETAVFTSDQLWDAAHTTKTENRVYKYRNGDYAPVHVSSSTAMTQPQPEKRPSSALGRAAANLNYSSAPSEREVELPDTPMAFNPQRDESRDPIVPTRNAESKPFNVFEDSGADRSNDARDERMRRKREEEIRQSGATDPPFISPRQPLADITQNVQRCPTTRQVPNRAESPRPRPEADWQQLLDTTPNSESPSKYEKDWEADKQRRERFLAIPSYAEQRERHKDARFRSPSKTQSCYAIPAMIESPTPARVRPAFSLPPTPGRDTTVSPAKFPLRRASGVLFPATPTRPLMPAPTNNTTQLRTPNTTPIGSIPARSLPRSPIDTAKEISSRSILKRSAALANIIPKQHLERTPVKSTTIVDDPSKYPQSRSLAEIVTKELKLGSLIDGKKWEFKVQFHIKTESGKKCDFEPTDLTIDGKLLWKAPDTQSSKSNRSDDSKRSTSSTSSRNKMSHRRKKEKPRTTSVSTYITTSLDAPRTPVSFTNGSSQRNSRTPEKSQKMTTPQTGSSSGSSAYHTPNASITIRRPSSAVQPLNKSRDKGSKSKK